MAFEAFGRQPAKVRVIGGVERLSIEASKAWFLFDQCSRHTRQTPRAPTKTLPT